MEVWKDIKGYEGVYQVSNYGNVRRILKGGQPRLLKNRPSLNYYTVSLSYNHTKKTYAIHRLVAETFLLRKPWETEVNHKDGNKLNNNVDNLEWVTQKENIQHAINVLNKNPFGKPPRKVKCIDANGTVVAEYRSITDAAKALGKLSARAAITNVCKGYTPSAYGYKWEYAD